MNMVYVCSVLALWGSLVQAVPETTESFLAQPVQQKTKKKNKKSLATIRQEFIEQSEAYAHALIVEMFTVSSRMAQAATVSAAEKKTMRALVQDRYQSLEKAEKFFATGIVAAQKKCKVFDDLSVGAWRLMQQYARVQEKLLDAMTALLEQDETHYFMKADKAQLQSYQDTLHSLQEESESFGKKVADDL